MRAVAIMVRNAQSAETEPIARIEVPVAGGPAVIAEVRADWAEAIETLLAGGVPSDAGGRLYLADGETLLLALPSTYRGSRFWAEDIG